MTIRKLQTGFAIWQAGYTRMPVLSNPASAGRKNDERAAVYVSPLPRQIPHGRNQSRNDRWLVMRRMRRQGCGLFLPCKGLRDGRSLRPRIFASGWRQHIMPISPIAARMRPRRECSIPAHNRCITRRDAVASADAPRPRRKLSAECFC